MAEALIKGLVSGGVQPDRITVCDPLDARLQWLSQTYGVRTSQNNTAALSGHTIVFAVKPAQLDLVLQEVQSAWRPGVLGLSIVAGARLEKFERALPTDTPFIRAMPNTPCVIGEGITALAGNAHAGDTHWNQARALFSAVGRVLDLPESYFDAVTGLSGSGPAYVTLILEALIDAGVQQGLPRRIARDLVCQTVVGSARLVQDSGKHPAELKDQVVTPAGTTAAGLQVLEEAAVRATLCLAVRAATQRSRELGHQEIR